MPDRPNILVFLTDDHGQWAAGCYGNREIASPTMDHLAATGVRMTRAFTTCPVSSPARASFFTGRLPSQHGIHDWLFERELPYADHPGLRGQRTIAQLLHNAGYTTALCGKWHCGDDAIVQPGFDRWFAHLRQGPHCGDVPFSDQGEQVVKHSQLSDAVTDDAVRFLRSRDRDRPFFLCVGYVDTHTPHRDHPPRLVERYRQCTFDDIPDESPADCHGTVVIPWPDNEVIRRDQLANYYAAVTHIDEQMARVLDVLGEAGDLDNTLIVYTADHGHMNGHHGLHTKGNATVPQNLIDESILVPCLLSWPGVLLAGGVCDRFVDHCDLFNTLLDAAGVELDDTVQKEINSPGRSYLPLLRGDTDDWRDAQFSEYGNARMIRTDTHKLIERYAGPNGHFADELYDLVADPRERSNVIDQQADIAASLRRRLHEHFDRYQITERSGRNITDQPRCSPTEPWRRDPTPIPQTPTT